ncbi:AI-2E family transporter [Pontibacter diazotrophicus]|uniref:AI-2E family transporter n=1 Tax=Pontibacter diazotrophicus TaxID=1400979 RepID=A0A3D8L9H2_9BACT|nr:AI-2E family transporter [Pontibacter diazotrophicus]RDV14055.1 AI-2E family transporter [Pontibacter diazotrophicus]
MDRHFSLRQFNQVLLALLLFFGILYLARDFMVPVAIGGLFAMLLAPACRKLEQWGIPRIVAAIICVLAVVVLLVLLLIVLIDQLTALAYDLPRLDYKLTELLDEAHRYIKETFDVSREKQNEYIQQSFRSTLQYAGVYLRSLFLFASSLVVSFIIVMSYTLLFLLYRGRLKSFISRLTANYDANAREIVSKITTVASSYISGVFLVVLILTAINTAGLMVIGIDHALLFGLVAGLLNIIPYLGSLVGSLIPVLFALLTKDSLWTPLVVAIFFLVVQQIESYILTPNITGAKVKLNPMATLMVLLLGSAIWGIVGMILFVPYLGIAKVIFDNINRLRPFGFVLGKDEEEEHS